MPLHCDQRSPDLPAGLDDYSYERKGKIRKGNGGKGGALAPTGALGPSPLKWGCPTGWVSAWFEVGSRGEK